jgi:hypothetical protein
MIRCLWKMPENELIVAGGQCVKFADHGKVHVIAAYSGSSVTFWQVKPRKRTVKAVAHVDLRNETILDDEQCVDLYHFIKTARGSVG